MTAPECQQSGTLIVIEEKIATFLVHQPFLAFNSDTRDLQLKEVHHVDREKVDRGRQRATQQTAPGND